MRIDLTMTQKEETYQVFLDIIKNTTFYKAFLTSTDVPEICMQQFWFTITKIKNSNFYEFKLENKKCLVDVKYVNFAELIWEDFSYQIDNRWLKKGIREIMPYPRFTKIIINHFLSIRTSVPKGLPSSLHTIKDDSVLSRMKFVRIRKDFQEQEVIYNLKPASIEVSDESDSKPARKQTANRRVIKKKILISAKDNIISEPDISLELGKSMSLTEAEKEETATQFHATHERIVTESDLEPARRIPLGIAFRYTLNVSKKISPDLSQKQKGIQTLTIEEQFAADTMQSLKASRKSSKSQPHVGGSSEGTCTKPGVPDESTSILSTSHERTGTKPGVLDKADAEKSKEVKDDNKKVALPPSSSSLSVSLGFGNQFLNLSSDKSTIGNLKDTTDVEINSLLDVQIQKEILDIKSPSILNVPVLVISEPSVLSPILEIPTSSSTTTPPPHYVSTISHVLLQTTTLIPTIALDVTTILDPLPAII
nr:hypothetical protein [Tanacetum cinerariifolium]